MAAESSRLQEEVKYLDNRITSLYESACRLEAGIDKRLTQMASDTVQHARNEMENAASATSQQLASRNAEILANQTRAACDDLKRVEKEVVESFSHALEAQVAEALHGFEHSMEELSKQCVERWRLTLASSFNALVKGLGAQFQLRANSDSDEREY
jgi:hypothetical protein